jgi:acyl phosphate:glycerol-3-phosphate acyltransferase
MQLFLFGIFLSYVIGSFPTSYVCVKLLKGVDLRQQGSGNLGATNAARVLGKQWGGLILLLDILKGVFCVVVLAGWIKYPAMDLEVVKVCFGVAVVLGHVYPLFLKFHGGKGVATSAGVFLGLQWQVVAIAGLGFLVVFYRFRYVSLGSIVAALILPLAMYGLSDSKLYLVVSMVISVLVVKKHKENIRRIILGKEKKLN